MGLVCDVSPVKYLDWLVSVRVTMTNHIYRQDLYNFSEALNRLSRQLIVKSLEVKKCFTLGRTLMLVIKTQTNLVLLGERMLAVSDDYYSHLGSIEWLKRHSPRQSLRIYYTR